MSVAKASIDFSLVIVGFCFSVFFFFFPLHYRVSWTHLLFTSNCMTVLFFKTQRDWFPDWLLILCSQFSAKWPRLNCLWSFFLENTMGRRGTGGQKSSPIVLIPHFIVLCCWLWKNRFHPHHQAWILKWSVARESFLSPREHLSVPQNIFGFHNWGTARASNK